MKTRDRTTRPKRSGRVASNVSRHLRVEACQPACGHHGAERRDPHLCRAGSAHQSPRPFSAQPWPEAPRSLRDPDGEQYPLCRVLRRRRTCGPLLHLHQLLPHAGRGRLYRQQQRIEGVDHLAGQARGRGEGGRAVSEGGSHPRRRRPRRRQAHLQFRRGDLRPAGNADRGREPRDGDALLIRDDRPTERYRAPVAGAASLAAVAAV